MKKIDEEGLKLCALQADIFAKSLETTQCSAPIFIRRFMNSQVAARMDHRGFLLEASDAVSILNEVEAQYGPTSYGKERYGREELYWLGYLYRYWAYTYEKSSKQVYKQMKAKELRKLYYPYHSLDPAQAMYRRYERTDGIKAESGKDLTYSQYYAWLDAATEARDRFLRGEITESEALRIIIVP